MTKRRRTTVRRSRARARRMRPRARRWKRRRRGPRAEASNRACPSRYLLPAAEGTIELQRQRRVLDVAEPIAPAARALWRLPSHLGVEQFRGDGGGERAMRHPAARLIVVRIRGPRERGKRRMKTAMYAQQRIAVHRREKQHARR